MKKNSFNSLFFIFLFIFIMIFFANGINNYFLGDDWFHLNITQIDNWRQFFNFFNPLENPQQTAFYRPIPNQLFFFLTQSLFGLKPFFYHLPIYLLFLFSIYLFKRLLVLLNFSKKSIYLAVLIFALSATHFTQLYFISAGQEIFMIFFVLLYLVLFLTAKSQLKVGAQFSLIAALLSKDTALVAPLIIFFITNQALFFNKKNKFKFRKLLTKNVGFLVSCFLVLIYLIVRFFIFDQEMINHETYRLSFSIKETLTSAYFYFWWLLGAPELIQDYMPNPYSFLPRFFLDFGFFAQLIIILSLLLFFLLLVNFIFALKKVKKENKLKKIFFACLFICFGLLPVIFLPTHRFTIQLGLPMLGMAMFLATILDSHNKLYLMFATLIVFLSLNFLTIKISENSHYSSTRARISKKVVDYFEANYPQVAANTAFFITNGQTEGYDITEWGSSRQLAFALWHDNFIQVFYEDKTLLMNYEDLFNRDALDEDQNKNIIYISATSFLD